MDADEYWSTPRSEFKYDELYEKLNRKESLTYWEKRCLYFAPLNSNGNPNRAYKLIEQLKIRHDEDRDTVIAVTGQQGMGKSSLSVLLAQELGKELGTRRFDLQQDVIYAGDEKEVYNKMYGEDKEFTKSVPIVFDEFLSYASKHKWFSTENRYLEDVFLVSRTQNKPCFLVGPRLGDFSEQFRNQRIIINLEILRRGRAVVFLRHPSSFLSDPWNLKGLEKLIMEHSRDFLMYNIDQKRAFYVDSGVLVGGVVAYPNLDRSSMSRYKVLSALAKEVKIKPKDEEKASVLRDRRDVAFAKMLFKLHEGGKNFTEIGEFAGLSPTTVSRYVDDFGKRKLKEMPLA